MKKLNDIRKRHLDRIDENNIRGKQYKRSKTKSEFPVYLEDNHKKAVAGITKKAEKVIKARIGNAKKGYSVLNDADIEELILDELADVNDELDDILDRDEIIAVLLGSATTARQGVYKDWKKNVKETLGKDLNDAYYDEMFGIDDEEWATSQADALMDGVHGISGLISEGLSLGAGLGLEIIMGMAVDLLDKGMNQIENSAGNEMATFISEANKEYQEDAGCMYYIWRTQGDANVRECHAELDGKVCRWDNPPEMWYMTKDGIYYDGRCCHPGEDYNCRCVAEPIYDIEHLYLEIKDERV